MLERKKYIDLTVMKSLHPKPVFELLWEANDSLQYTKCSSEGNKSLVASVLWQKKNNEGKVWKILQSIFTL